jgi:N-acetylgalactosamine-N,N'-diacetylbacillosaminyl-diphospho-undecaprenol 4-alpha-N-acetylgalactosaminyltransferase
VIYHGPIEYEIGGNLINLETPTGSLWKKIKNTFHRVMKLKKLIKDISPDYIVSFMGNLQPILTLNPVIVSIHIDPDFTHLHKAFLFRTVYKFPNVRKIITVSKGIEKKLNNNYNLKKTKTIYNPIDLKLLAQKAVDFDYILAVGRLCRQKGFDILINAFAKSNLKNKIKLIILGEGKERNNLEKLINGLDLKSQVLLYGKVDNPFIYMKHATFFVLSSRFEGFGNVIIEALACETPVIATNCESGPSEIIENSKNGLLVPSEDVELLKDAMERLYHDGELYMKLKSNARKSVERFDVKNIVKDWINLFEKEYCL